MVNKSGGRLHRPTLSALRLSASFGAAFWLAGVLFTSDLTIPAANLRRFRRVLMVFPHPDDESVNCGGTIRRLSASGAAVTLILLTQGECGTPSGAYDPRLKWVRHQEATRAARILGVARLIHEDFGDGRLENRIAEVTSYLRNAVARIQPDLIITYDPTGLYGHPDHVACSQALTQLWRDELHAIPLWYVALPRRVVRLLRWIRQLTTDAQLEEMRPLPTTRLLIGPAVVPKIGSWYAHRSQRGSMAKGLGHLVPAWFAVSMLQFEYFAEAARENRRPAPRSVRASARPKAHRAGLSALAPCSKVDRPLA
jgi:LmbE family N-acetylglucosaminyl deacetylase